MLTWDRACHGWTAVQGGIFVLHPHFDICSARCVRLLLLLALVGTLPSVVAARDEVPTRPSPPVVTLELRLGDNAPVVVAVREGELATIEHAEFGYRVGLVPRLAGLSEGDVELELVVPPRRSGEPVGDLYERVRGRLGFSTFSGAAGIALEMTIRTIGVLPSGVGPCGSAAAGSRVSGPDDTSQMMPVGGCCMICQGVKSCGCAVTTACGTCCGCSFCQ